MAQNYWVTKEKVESYKFFAVEYTNEKGEQDVRQAGNGPFLTLKGAQNALDIVNNNSNWSNGKIIEFKGTWQDL